MNDDITPPPAIPAFPQYAPPNGQVFAHPKQAKHLFKIMGKLMTQRFKTKISPVKKRVDGKKKKKEI